MTSSSKITPWVAPFAVFMVFLVIVDGWLPDEHYVLYPLKSLIVAGVIVWFWGNLPSLRPTAPWLSVLVGIVGLVLWVRLEPFSNLLADTTRQTMHSVPTQPIVGLDPFKLYPAAEAWLLFACRVAGISLVVPVMEELFWRGFLMRWLIREDFEAVPLGSYQPFSFLVTTVLFASVHGAEWPQGLVVGILYGALFVQTKSLGNIMLAHGVTNFLLAFYCLLTSDWHFLATANAIQLPK